MIGPPFSDAPDGCDVDVASDGLTQWPGPAGASRCECPTNNAALSFTFTFSEAVQNFDASDLQVLQNSVLTAIVPAVTPQSASVYTVSFTATQDGVITLRLPAASDIRDASFLSLSATFPVDASVTLDRVAPTVSLTSPQSPITGDSTLVFHATFSEAVSLAGLNVASFLVSNGQVASVDVTGNPLVIVTVDQYLDGAVTLTLPASQASVVADAAGNTLAGLPQSLTVEVLRTSPTAEITAAAPRTNASPMLFTVVFSEPVVGFDASDLSLGNVAPNSVSLSSTDSRVFSVSLQAASDGLVTVAIPGPSNIRNAVQNALTAPFPSLSVEFDSTTQQPPSLTQPQEGAVVGPPARALQTRGALNVRFTLPEAPLLNSVRVQFAVPGGAVAAELALTIATAGSHAVDALNVDALGSHSSVSSVSGQTALGEGEWDVRVSYRDALGNPAAATPSRRIYVDRTAPTLSLSYSGASPTTSRSLVFRVAVSAGDFVPLPTAADFAVSNGGVTAIVAVGTAGPTLLGRTQRGAELQSGGIELQSGPTNSAFDVTVEATRTGTVTIALAAGHSLGDVAGNAGSADSASSSANAAWACASGVYGPTCRCAIGSEPLRTQLPVQLRVSPTHSPGSGFAADQLTLVFAESLKYSSAAVLFGSPCATSTPAAWSAEEIEGSGNPADPDSCIRVWRATFAWSAVYDAVSESTCGLRRSATASTEAELVFQGDMRVRNVESFVVGGSGGATQRTVEHAVPFEVRFPRQAAFGAATIVAYSEVFTAAAISAQSATRDPNAPTTMLAEVQLVTSVQWPFVLRGTGLVVSAASGITVRAASLANSECAAESTGLCENRWTLVLADQGSAACRFDGDYTVTFVVGCRGVQADCPLAPGATQTVTFRLRSSNHCASVADTIGLTLSIASYEDAALSVRKSTFVHLQRAHFAVDFAAGPKATVAGAHVVEAALSRGASSWILYANGELTSDGSAVGFVTTPGTTRASLSFVADATFLAIPADSSAAVTVSVVGAARYAFDPSGARPAEPLGRVVLQRATWRLDEVDVREQTARPPSLSVSVRGGGGAGGSGSGAEDASSASLIGGTFGVALAGFAALVAVLLVALLVAAVMRRRRRRQQLAATGEGAKTLVSSSSSASLAPAAAATSEGDAEGEQGEASESSVGVDAAATGDLRAVQAHYAELDATRPA